MPNTFGNLIFTTHASERMKERSISADRVEEVILSAPHVHKQSSTTSKFVKVINSRKYHVIAEWKTAQRKWLVISVWVRGEEDKEALSVQILLLPFRLIWWLIKKIFFSK